MTRISRDSILYGALSLEQPESGPRVNADTVLLAAYVRSGFSRWKGEFSLLEMGCASGAVTLILALRFPDIPHLWGMDIQRDLVEMAKTNASANGLRERVSFIEGDIRRIRDYFPPQSFRIVVMNPPYEEPGRGRPCVERAAQTARQGSAAPSPMWRKPPGISWRSAADYISSSRRIGRGAPSILSSRGLEPKRLRFVHETGEKSVCLSCGCCPGWKTWYDSGTPFHRRRVRRVHRGSLPLTRKKGYHASRDRADTHRNLGDMTERALRNFRRATSSPARTRDFLPLLRHLTYQALASYHAFNEKDRRRNPPASQGRSVVALIRRRDTISDPGTRSYGGALTPTSPSRCSRATAFVPALILSGLPRTLSSSSAFCRKKRGKAKDSGILAGSLTLLFYLSPHKAEKQLEDILRILGERKAALLREISKIHEEARRGSLSALLESVRGGVRGELVLVVAGSSVVPADEEVWQEAAEKLLQSGAPLKEVVKIVSEEYSVSKNAVKTFLFGLPKGMESLRAGGR